MQKVCLLVWFKYLLWTLVVFFLFFLFLSFFMIINIWRDKSPWKNIILSNIYYITAPSVTASCYHCQYNALSTLLGRRQVDAQWVEHALSHWRPRPERCISPNSEVTKLHNTILSRPPTQAGTITNDKLQIYSKVSVSLQHKYQQWLYFPFSGSDYWYIVQHKESERCDISIKCQTKLINDRCYNQWSAINV